MWVIIQPHKGRWRRTDRQGERRPHDARHGRERPPAGDTDRGRGRGRRDAVATIQVPQRKGRPKSRPRQMIADNGYDSRNLRRSIHQRGIRSCILPKRRRESWKPAHMRPVTAYFDEYPPCWPVRFSSTPHLCHRPARLVVIASLSRVWRWNVQYRSTFAAETCLRPPRFSACKRPSASHFPRHAATDSGAVLHYLSSAYHPRPDAARSAMA
jgi:hypothetical protein